MKIILFLLSAIVTMYILFVSMHGKDTRYKIKFFLAFFAIIIIVQILFFAFGILGSWWSSVIGIPISALLAFYVLHFTMGVQTKFLRKVHNNLQDTLDFFERQNLICKEKMGICV